MTPERRGNPGQGNEIDVLHNSVEQIKKEVLSRMLNVGPGEHDVIYFNDRADQNVVDSLRQMTTLPVGRAAPHGYRISVTNLCVTITGLTKESQVLASREEWAG